MVYYSHHLAERPQQRAFAGPYTIILQPFSKGEKEKKKQLNKKKCVAERKKRPSYLAKQLYWAVPVSTFCAVFFLDEKRLFCGFMRCLTASPNSITIMLFRAAIKFTHYEGD